MLRCWHTDTLLWVGMQSQKTQTVTLNIPLAVLAQSPGGALWQQKGKFAPQALHLTLDLSLEAKQLHLQLFSLLILITSQVHPHSLLNSSSPSLEKSYIFSLLNLATFQFNS